MSLGVNVLYTLKAGLWGLLLAISSIATAQTDNISIFRDFDGKPQRLESYTGGGKWLVVMIWASDCHVCNTEAAGYAAFHNKQQDKEVAVLGISMDGEEKKAAALDFIKRHELPFPNLIGEPGITSLYYASLTKESLLGTPTFLIFDPDGQLAAAQAGAVPPDSVERFIAAKNKARSAAQ